jgi:hypothetical protein
MSREGDGWFVLNVRDAAWMRNDVFGARCAFEADGRLVKERPELEVLVGGRAPVAARGVAGVSYSRHASSSWAPVARQCASLKGGFQRS